jgi:hypothetical protein
MRTEATLNINKKITVVTGNLVYTSNMSDFDNIVVKHNIVYLTGLSKPAKKSKYEQLLLNNGFTLLKVYWNENAGFEGKNKDVINYRIAYERN